MPELPRAWTEQKIQAIIDYYDVQDEYAAVLEDEAILNASDSTMIEIPLALAPTVRALIIHYQQQVVLDTL